MRLMVFGMAEPPVIAGLSDVQKAAVSEAYRAIEVECDAAVEDMLTNAGLRGEYGELFDS